MRRVLYFLPALFFLAVASYFAVTLFSGRDPHTLPSAMIDKPAPAFDLAALDGGPGLQRDALLGQVVVVNFFASWCVPCVVEQPLLLRLSQRDHVALYGIDYKDKPEDATKFLAQRGDPFRRIGVDRDGRTAIEFGVYGVPETYVVDKTGHIRYRHVGPLTADVLENTLLPMIAELGRS